jgi:hypothetical protein
MYKIAIGISTRNRENSFKGLMHGMLNTLLADYDKNSINIFVVDDASDVRYKSCKVDYQFEQRAGISAIKNKCLQLCYESGADHIFLLDDDVRILKSDWWKPYVESGEHHLCATFLPKHREFITCDNPYSEQRELKKFKSHLLGNGYCLYFTRHCIETVGGFDTNYNNKYEHCDLSRRIFNAGLTKHVYQDVINSNELIYCLDQNNSIQRSFTEKEMQQNLKDGYDYFRSQAKSKEYIEFRT